MSPILMSFLLVGLPAMFMWSAARRFAAAAKMQPEPRFSVEGDDLPKRIQDTLIYAFGQRKMPYYKGAGIAHMMIFAGFLVVQLNTIMLWGRGYDEHFDIFGLVSTSHAFGQGYALIKDIFSVLVVLGATVFIYFRTINVQRRMTLSGEGLVILGIIISMMVADLVYNGARLAIEALDGERAAGFVPYEPVASTLSVMLGSASFGTLEVLMKLGFWTHAALPLIFLNILPYSKHFHIITAIPNVFARNLQPNKLPTTTDLEGKVEREEAIGFAKITDLSWKDVMDLYTCTECGRCSDNCPAYTTEKTLSPKHVTLALRDHLFACEPQLLYKGTSAEVAEGEPHRHEMHHADPPKGAYFTVDQVVELIPNVIDPHVVWACTTCRACEEQCPVMISYVDKFVNMRRNLVMMKNEFPAELQKPFNGIETNGNPWNMSAMDRANWTEGLDVPLLSDKKDADVLYWVGCAASYDDRAKKIARATVQLFKQAGINYAILGTEETCTGDPARRAGNEFLFQMIAQQNVETLKGYEVEKKTIVTTCPHCLNTLLNEYPDFGGHFEVVHHSVYLNDLVKSGKLVPKNGRNEKVVFHDSCYLGRYNDVYDAPRDVIKSIPGVELTEPQYWNRNKGLCCGAGGAQMFMEEQNEKRVNVKRTLQLLDTGAKTIATGCPFCMTMLTDGLKSQEKEESIKQLDIAELLLQSVGEPPAAAE